MSTGDRARRPRRNTGGTVHTLPTATTEGQITAAVNAGCPEPLARALARRADGPITIAIRSSIITITLSGADCDGSITNVWRAITAAYRTATNAGTCQHIIDLPAPITSMTWAHNGQHITVRGNQRRLRRRSPGGPAAAIPLVAFLSEAGVRVIPATGVVASVTGVVLGSVQLSPGHTFAEAAPRPESMPAATAVVTSPRPAWPSIPSNATSPFLDQGDARPTAPAATPTPSMPPAPTIPSASPSPAPLPTSLVPETPSPAPSATTPPPAPYAAPADPPGGQITPSPSPEPSPEHN